ncbi:MAG TPA: glycosidase [Candidatus Limiplasma sp.]|nr:glycosidase [Candidatus Limiplasma sp.]
MDNKQYAVSDGPILNAYPDSMGGTLKEIVRFVQTDASGAFATAYILPSLFNTDLDRGFSVIDYGLNKLYAAQDDLDALKAAGVSLKLDIILNHASVLSPQFQDILKQGDASPYRDFFIDWNRFWAGHGTLTTDGYIQPDEADIKDMFFRKPGLPILMVRLPDGRNVPYWNTFYQEVRYPRMDAQDIMRAADMQYASADRLAGMVNSALDAGQKPAEIDFGCWEAARPAVTEWLESNRKYLGQLDLNVQSETVWAFYDHTLQTLAEYGAEIIRLDAFAYAPKTPGKRNFLNEPDTWELLDKVHTLAKRYQLTLLPEIHASYAEKTYEKLSSQGYMCYDFFLPGLILDALERYDGAYLAAWAQEQQAKGIRTVNMLGCHDGIPLLDLKGLLPEEYIEKLIETVVARGGMVKDLHGKKNVYYQVNATYYSALGANDKKLLLARALQLFMPGKPQIWYLDLFAGENDLGAVAHGGPAAHKEINRTNMTDAQIAKAMERDIVKDQLALLRLRNTCPAFGFDANLIIDQPDAHTLRLIWHKAGHTAALTANLKTCAFDIMVNGKPFVWER